MSTSNLSTDSPKVMFLDFDGVLAIPYTSPAQHYVGLSVMLYYLKHHLGWTLCLVSFNPTAESCLKQWQIEHYFTAIRAGSNQQWVGQYVDDRKHLCKSQQIQDILDNELKGHSYERLVFFDDSTEHVYKIKTSGHLFTCQAYHVDSDVGLIYGLSKCLSSIHYDRLIRFLDNPEISPKLYNPNQSDQSNTSCYLVSDVQITNILQTLDSTQMSLPSGIYVSNVQLPLD